MINEDTAVEKSKIPPFILTWFLLDAIVALAPPLYWTVDQHRSTFIVGVPATMIYFLFVCTFIMLSLVAAYHAEYKNGGDE